MGAPGTGVVVLSKKWLRRGGEEEGGGGWEEGTGAWVGPDRSRASR